MKYSFQPFIRSEYTDCRMELSIPELSDGFDSSLETSAEGMVPVSYYTEELPAGIYAIHIVLEATQDIDQLFLFTGRKLLRDIISLKQGERYQRTYYQSIAEIIPRYYEQAYPVQNLFFTYCTSQPEAVTVMECHAELADKVPVIYLCGDSTVTDQSSEIPYNPGACYASWGQALPAFLSGSIAVENQAHCGLTTETFRSEGHMDIVKKYIQAGDFCLIQFGHNDQKLAHLLADREYPINLKRYVAEIKAAGATPVLVTSLGRNIWNTDGNYNDLLAEHAQAVKDVAKETGIDYIDLHEFSMGFLKQHGMEISCGYFHPGDYTHTNEYGAYVFASYIAQELNRLYPDIISNVTADETNAPGFIPPENLWAMLEQKNNRASGNEQKEQFDSMEKTTGGLLAALAAAKM